LSTDLQRYRLAGRCLSVDRELPLAASVRVDACRDAFSIRKRDTIEIPGTQSRFSSWVAGHDRAVSGVRAEAGRIAWHVDGIGDFMVDLEESVGFYDGRTPTAPDALQEILLGPFAVLMLASADCFSLHASGSEIAGKSCLFLGDSGAGKSTIARELMARGFPRTADDLSPVDLADGFQHRPGFPQLKVRDDLQYGLREPQSLEIGGLFFIEQGEDTEPRAARADRSWAFEQLLRQTMSVKLFNAQLLAAHMRFIGALVESVPCWRVAYPHREASIAWMADFIGDSVQ
jgi:hypothetical protein